MGGLDGIADVIAALALGLYNQSSIAINNLCSLVWADVFPYVVGLVFGYHIILMIMEDDLTEGVKKLFIALFPMLIVAWLIRPDPGGCNVVMIKDQALQARVLVTQAIAPGVSGSNPADLITNTFDGVMVNMSRLMTGVAERTKIESEPAEGSWYDSLFGTPP